jgi:hypothetical protein
MIHSNGKDSHHGKEDLHNEFQPGQSVLTSPLWTNHGMFAASSVQNATNLSGVAVAVF